MSQGQASSPPETVRVFRAGQLDAGTAAALVSRRIAAITHAPPGVDTLDAATVEAPPGAAMPAHHHGPRECLVTVVSGRMRVRWGPQLEHTALAAAGDCVMIPGWVPHQEMNASPEMTLRYLLVRDDQEPVMVLLELPAASRAAPWADAHHPLRQP